MADLPTPVLLRKLEMIIEKAVSSLKPERKKEPNRYFPIILGAVIGLLPSLMLLAMQATVQREQFLFDRKLNLISELSRVVHVKGNELLAREFELELAFKNHPWSKLSPEQKLALYQKTVEFNRLSLAWGAEINVQLNVLNGLYGRRAAKLPRIDLVPQYSSNDPTIGPDVNAPAVAKSLEQTLATTRKSIASAIRDLQSTLATISSALE
jgi:hypothetical protein